MSNLFTCAAIRTLAAIAVLAPPLAIAAGKACTLATPAEVEAAIGQKVSFSPGMTMPKGVEACSGKAGPLSVTIRTFQRTSDAGGEKEKAGLEAMKKAGMKVDVQKLGPITCVAIERLRPVAEKMLSRF